MNFNNILTATHAAIVSGSTVEQAAKTGFALVRADKPTLAVLLREERAGQQVRLGVQAAYRALVAGMRAVLVADKVDVSDAGIVRDAMRAEVWLDEGYAVALAKSKAKPLTKAEQTIYERVSQRISRLARDVVANDKPAMQRVPVKVRLPAVLVASIKAATKDADVSYADALAALKRVYGK